ncbi:hypothetical protein [Bradyrhizobium sediminis]|nr:hypothetical protein [Bradyrhizobium sediminis]
MSGLIAFGLASAPTGVVAAEPHAHAATEKIRLDNGKKWPTDAALRRGMSEIRTAMADALAPIHRNKFSSEDFEQLAGRVQGQIDYVTANCKLPEAADHQLHVVLEQILDGIAIMKADKGRDQGAVKIVQALDQYGAHFNHAGWKKLTH